MNPSLSYFSIFFLSFIILSLQILVGVLLVNISYLPFLAVPFTFLGSSIAGAFVYTRYFKKNDNGHQEELLNYFFSAGISILFFTIAIKYLPLICSVSNGNSETSALIEMLARPILIGLISVLVFLSLNIPYMLIYKYNSKEAPKLYFFDLLGASSGCIFSVFILKLFQLGSALILLANLLLLLFFLLARHSKKKFIKIKSAVYLLSCFLILLLNIKTDFLETGIASDNIKKRMLQRSSGYEEIWRRWNAYSRVSLFMNDEKNREQDKYFFMVKGGKVRVYPFKPNNPYSLKSPVGRTPAMFGFLLGKPKSILILFAGVGADMIEAYSYSGGASDITGVELNPLIPKKALDLGGYNLRDFFAKKNVHFVVQEARSYVESTDKKFDSIILTASGSSEMELLGTTNPTMNYLYTKEAFKSYLKHLTPNGIIAVVSRNKIKVAAIAKAALEELGYDNVANKIIIIGDRACADEENILALDGCLSVLVKNTDFTKEELDKIQDNLLKMNSVWVYNRYYTRGNLKIFEDLLKCKNLEYFLAGLSNKYDKDYSLAKDNKPFIANTFLIKSFFSSNSWKEVLSRRWSDHAISLLFGFFMISIFILLTLLGLLLCVMPFILKAKNISLVSNFRILVYFATIGLGFIFVELAMMQLFTLFLGNPIYAYSIVLAGLLLMTGAGSFLSSYLFNRRNMSIKTLSLITFFILLLFYLFIPWLNEHLLQLNFFARLIMILLLILPIGICLGMFFPQGLKKLYNNEKDLIPLACGLNGCMSIAGSGLVIVLPPLVGVHFFILIAAFLYLVITTFDISA